MNHSPTTTRLKMANGDDGKRRIDGDPCYPPNTIRTVNAPCRHHTQPARASPQAIDRPGFVACQARASASAVSDKMRLSAVDARVMLPSTGYSLSARLADSVSASSSGSVIGVACRYSTFGLSAKTADAATSRKR